MKLRATFPNLDNALFPEPVRQHPHARRHTRRASSPCPVAAVQHGTNNNTFVYLLDTGASTVKLQNVTVRRRLLRRPDGSKSKAA